MIRIDSRGKTCPVPVIMLKKALKTSHDSPIRQIVDNEIAKENIEKMLTELKITFSSYKENTDYIVDINPSDLSETGNTEVEKVGDIIAFSSNTMGSGSDELGKTLMGNFIYTLTESDVLPSKIIIYNSGVKMVCENPDIISDLKKLDKSGVQILVCGLCLNYYGLEKELKVGRVSNMYAILQAKLNATKIIYP